MSEFRMPSLGADMAAGTLVEWLKQPGDTVARGDIVAVVETEKGAIEVEIFEDGVLEAQLVEPGRKVPVGTPLARIRGPGEAPGPAPEAAPAPAPKPAPVPPPRAPAAPAVERPPAPAEGRLRISPAAARRAAELGLDPRRIAGSGPGGAIQLADVERAQAPAAPAPVPEAADPRAAMRRAIAAAMSRANRDIPHYHLDRAVDAGPLTTWLEAENRSRPVERRLLVGVLFLKATALALKEAPELNGFWIDGAARPSEAVHVGWATSIRGGGLIAPAIRDADKRPVDELMAAMRDVVKRVRSGGLRSSELSDATVTITSLGERGADRVHGVIYPPQVALVGFGAIVERPWVVDGAVVSRPVVTVTLSADHRASDGQRGGRFLNILEGLLKEPERL